LHPILPEIIPAPTLFWIYRPYLSLHSITRNLKLYSWMIQAFNRIQAQVFQALYASDKNVFIGALTGSGTTICEFSLLE